MVPKLMLAALLLNLAITSMPVAGSTPSADDETLSMLLESLLSSVDYNKAQTSSDDYEPAVPSSLPSVSQSVRPFSPYKYLQPHYTRYNKPNHYPYYNPLASFRDYKDSQQTVYMTNCEFQGIEAYQRIDNVNDPIQCGNFNCGGETACTHFEWFGEKSPEGLVVGGKCFLKSAPLTGGNWYSTFPHAVFAVCGFIRSRAERALVKTVKVASPSICPSPPPPLEMSAQASVEIELCDGATSHIPGLRYIASTARSGRFTSPAVVPESNVTSTICMLLFAPEPPSSSIQISCTSSSLADGSLINSISMPEMVSNYLGNSYPVVGQAHTLPPNAQWLTVGAPKSFDSSTVCTWKAL